jgi:tetratricopeptide (TPR) repeat protein
MPHSRLLFIPVLCAAAALGHAQPTLLDTGYAQMYNLQFAEAHQSFQQWERQHPQDPLGFVSDAAAYLFSEFDRLHILQSEFFTHDDHFITDHKLAPDLAVKAKFDAALSAARQLAARAPNDKNAMFASVLAGGLQSDYTALIDKRYVAAWKDMKASRQEAERLLARDPDCYDAWVAIGVENYMLSIKPLVLRLLLRAAGGEADRKVGIEKLRLTAAKGRYLAPFARLLLGVAALREGDVTQARETLAALTKEYPRNPLFPQELQRLNAMGARGSHP